MRKTDVLTARIAKQLSQSISKLVEVQAQDVGKLVLIPALVLLRPQW
jgi:hypothetical protein